MRQSINTFVLGTKCGCLALNIIVAMLLILFCATVLWIEGQEELLHDVYQWVDPPISFGLEGSELGPMVAPELPYLPLCEAHPSGFGEPRVVGLPVGGCPRRDGHERVLWDVVAVEPHAPQGAVRLERAEQSPGTGQPEVVPPQVEGV